MASSKLPTVDAEERVFGLLIAALLTDMTYETSVGE